MKFFQKLFESLFFSDWQSQKPKDTQFIVMQNDLLISKMNFLLCDWSVDQLFHH